MVRCFCCLLVIAFVAVGCNGGNSSRATVSGTVKLDGRPVAGARLIFMPMKISAGQELGSVSYGTTDENGRYSLESRSKRPGATPGRNLVWISTRRIDVSSRGKAVSRREFIPRQYNSETGLTFVVPETGEKTADFGLYSSP